MVCEPQGQVAVCIQLSMIHYLEEGSPDNQVGLKFRLVPGMIQRSLETLKVAAFLDGLVLTVEVLEDEADSVAFLEVILFKKDM